LDNLQVYEEKGQIRIVGLDGYKKVKILKIIKYEGNYSMSERHIGIQGFLDSSSEVTAIHFYNHLLKLSVHDMSTNTSSLITINTVLMAETNRLSNLKGRVTQIEKYHGDLLILASDDGRLILVTET
jgi:hypothetical protein